jgi:phosphate transport system protein
MRKHFDRDLEDLQHSIIAMGVSVDEAVHKAVRALQDRTAPVAQEVIDCDDQIDEQENRIEAQALTILALHQPVASDLRRIAMILKINTDLERMADLAAEIARCALDLSQPPLVAVPHKLRQLAEVATGMVWHSLDAFFTNDKKQATKIWAMAEDMEKLHSEVVAELKQSLRETPAMVDACLALFTVTRALKRIADHAANIAEDVIFLVEGRIVRHHHEAVAVAE